MVANDASTGAATRSDGATPRITSLHLYPLKSAAGIALDTVEVTEVGLRLDRHWMVVDAAGGFMSQRTHPRMALLGTRFAPGTLCVGFPGKPPLELELPRREGSTNHGHDLVRVHVWHDDRWGVDCGEDAAHWMAEALGEPCRVLRAAAPPDAEPLSSEGRVRAGFADARPALVISVASLADLNERLTARGAAALPMNRFRPNVVVEGVAPYAEDDWGRVLLGDVRARGVNRCPRCATTTVDQARGEAAGPEPLRTLATYRRMEDGGAAFGMNVSFEAAGVLRAGAEVVTLP